MQLAEVINAVNDGDISRDVQLTSFPKIGLIEALDEKFERQASDIDGIDYEYIWQRSDYEDEFHGEIAIPYGNDGLCLIFCFRS